MRARLGAKAGLFYECTTLKSVTPASVLFPLPWESVGHHLHMTPVCGVSGWCVWEALYWKHLLTLAASITSTSVGDHLVLKHYNCQEGKY